MTRAAARRATASDHPGSSGGYRGTDIIYDVMGRVAQQSNPAEMTGGWSATGDDATGWRYTTQTYDWQGRPRITTAPDNTTREASYGGCGCAGGATVTLRGEEMMISGIARRRQQTITHDALGRAIRADEMNWDGTIYRTLRTTYNARDQVVEVRQEGASAAARVSTINYDGHGRVSSEQRPEQTSATSYLYNLDDTLQQVTDARGATANFLYNSRHLVTQVSYTTPNPTTIPNTPTVNYTYDAAGNRLSMTDGLGSVSYGYDSLSRLTSETRQFTGVPRAHQLSYQYNLAGGLTRITDPDNAQVNYEHDRVGRVTRVTGVGSVPTFISSIQYRAWGAAHRVTYGNQIYADVQYNTRLQPSSYELGGRPTSEPIVMRSDYHYHVDGRIRFVDNGVDDRFDRAYSFDHVGRVEETYTGGEARNFHNNQPGGTQDGAYRQTYTHDEWDNLTSRVGRFWSGFDSFTQTLNGRNQNPTYLYDAQGNLTQDETRTYRWDAAGRMVYSQDVTDATRNLTPSYDGDGRRVKRVGLNASDQMETTFYVTSSVLGGRTVAETTLQGESGTRYAYLSGEVVAEYGAGAATWMHRDPVTGSRALTQANGLGWVEREYDPTGVDVGLYDPFTFGSGPIEPEIPTFVPNEFGSGDCTLDGMPLDCARVAQLISSGAAVQCPDNDCSPRTIYNPNTGRNELSPITSDPRTGQLGYWGWNRSQLIITGEDGVSEHSTGEWERAFIPGSLNGFFSFGGFGQQPGSPPSRVPGVFELINQRQGCDRRIAAIFGGEGAVVATSIEPNTLQQSTAAGRDRSGHLYQSGVFHIYTNERGTPATGNQGGLYIPPGGRLVSGGEYYNGRTYNPDRSIKDEGKLENYFRFSYRRGPYRGVTISLVHVGGTSGGEGEGERLGNFRGAPPNVMGSIRIGNIAGLGGASPGYNHTHVKVYFDGRLTDPREIFCR